MNFLHNYKQLLIDIFKFMAIFNFCLGTTLIMIGTITLILFGYIQIIMMGMLMVFSGVLCLMANLLMESVLE